MTTIAKINNQHDYITLRIKFADNMKLNITRSRYGIKLSGDCASREALEFIDKWMSGRKDKTIGQNMETLREVAASVPDMSSFLEHVP